MGEQLGQAILELRTDDSALLAGIDRAEGEARGLAGEFKRTEASVSGSTRSMGAAATQMARQAQLSAAGIRSVGSAGKLSAFHLQNLSFQANDLVMGLATGQPIFRTFIQQGAQIAQIGAQAGVGLGGMARAMAGLLAPFAGIAALAGGVLLAFKAVKDNAASDAALQNYAKTLGLTKKEMKDLIDVTVTWGDVAGATFDVLAKRAGTSSEEVESSWSSAMKTLTEFGKFSIAVLIAGFAGLVKFVASAANYIGLAIGKGIAFGVNQALEFVEKLINGIADGVNKVASLFKALGVDVGNLGHVNLGRIEARGSFSNPLSDANSQFHQTFNDVMAGSDSISARASQRAQRRIRDQANGIIQDRDGGGDDGAARKAAAHKANADAISAEKKAYDEAVRSAQSYLDGLSRETDAIGQDAVAQKRMEVATAAAAARKAAAVAPTEQMRQALLAEAAAIEQAGAAWEKVYGNDQIAQFIKNTVEPLEFENSLIGKSADEQRRLRAERELTLAGIARSSDTWNRYIADVDRAADAERDLGKTFLETSQRALQSVQGIANSLRSHDFIGALQQAIELVIQLGQAFSLLGGKSSGGISGIIGAIGSIFGGGIKSPFGGPAAVPVMDETISLTGGGFSGFFASGGLIPSGSFGIVGEKGPEPVISTPRGTMVLPNSSLRAGGAGEQQASVVELHVKRGELFDAEVVRISGDVSVQVVRDAAPGIAQAAGAETIRQLTRPRM